MKLAEVIAYCADIERLIAEVYTTFAEKWPKLPQGIPWSDLAAEERVHGHTLDDVTQLAAARCEVAGKDHARKLQAMHDFLMTHYPLEDLSLDKALAFALDIEELEIDCIYRCLLALGGDDNGISSALRTAIVQDGQHAVRIAKVICGYSNDPTLRARALVFEARELRGGGAPPAPELEK